MRLCRFVQDGNAAAGFFLEDQIITLSAVAEAAGETIVKTDDLLIDI